MLVYCYTHIQRQTIYPRQGAKRNQFADTNIWAIIRPPKWSNYAWSYAGQCCPNQRESFMGHKLRPCPLQKGCTRVVTVYLPLSLTLSLSVFPPPSHAMQMREKLIESCVLVAHIAALHMQIHCQFFSWRLSN